MMSLRKTVHGLLGFADPDHHCRGIPHHCRGIPRRRRCNPQPSHAAGLRCVAGDIPSPPAHVLESAAVGPRPPLPTSSPSPSPPSPQQQQEQQQQVVPERIDDGTRGLSYLYGQGGGGGLELCTESLGFESCCDGRMGAEEERAEEEIRRRIEEARRRSPGEQPGCGTPLGKARPAKRRAEAREFPPPLSWLRGGEESGGRCRSFLKAVRRDGRFLLTEVRIERPEVLRASRQGGRLRLELVMPEPKAAEEEEKAELEEAVAEEALGEEEGEEAMAEKTETDTEEEEEEREDVEEEERWLPAPAALDMRGGGGGFRSWRCQEVAREGLSSSPFWVSRFVTTA